MVNGGRYDHTLDGLLACGGCCNDADGIDAGDSCEEFNPATGTWALSHTLQHGRSEHVSWSVEEGTILMGGVDSRTTSEIVKHDGTVESSFDLKYDTRFVIFRYYSLDK